MIGLKVPVGLESSFLQIRMVAAFVHCYGKILLLNTSLQITSKNVFRYGHHLMQIIDIWSNEHDDPDNAHNFLVG